MLKRPATLAHLVLTVLACVCLIAIAGSGTHSGNSTTLGDLQKQLSQQFQEQWGTDGFESVEITHFARPSAENELAVGLRIRWDGRNSTDTAVTLYRAAGTYYVGTFRLEGAAMPDHLQERAKSRGPVRMFASLPTRFGL
jgi:hypothetical protein